AGSLQLGRVDVHLIAGERRVRLHLDDGVDLRRTGLNQRVGVNLDGDQGVSPTRSTTGGPTTAGLACSAVRVLNAVRGGLDLRRSDPGHAEKRHAHYDGQCYQPCETTMTDVHFNSCSLSTVFVGGRPTSRGRRSFALPHEPPIGPTYSALSMLRGLVDITTFRVLVGKTLFRSTSLSSDFVTMRRIRAPRTTQRCLTRAKGPKLPT